jgi:hypothetical protein
MDVTPRPKSDQRRRHRPALACISCRKSKIRCDRQQPCGACVRSRHKTCVFDTARGPASRRSGTASTASDPAETQRRSDYDLGPVTPASSTPTLHDHDHNHDLDHKRSYAPPLRELGSTNPAGQIPDANGVLNRIFQLERRLEESTAAREPPDKYHQSTSRYEGQVIESYLAADIHAMSRGVVSKTRYFGQSHWMNGIVHVRLTSIHPTAADSLNTP